MDADEVKTPETSGTGFITYGLAWGVNNGVLSDKATVDAVKKGWAALVAAVDTDGMLHWVQQVGAGPNPVQENDTQLYGVGAFLLAASEMTKWDQKKITANPLVTLETEFGDIVIEVMIDRAPISGDDFLTYVERGLYEGEGFYRVVRANDNDNGSPKIDVIQGGLIDWEQGLPYIAHETTEMTGIKHTDGTMSLARDEPGTGSAAYFVIVLGDQPGLDYGGSRNPDMQGFATFGRVVNGMDVVRKIHSVPADRFVEEEGYTGGQILKEPVQIISARID
jgi:peptidyl-prolyl cis-trans isomerase A (cyclophilin A)